MELDFYCKASKEGELLSSDAEKIIKVMREGGLCVIPSDSSYILTGNSMIKGVTEDIDFLLDRKKAEMSLTFNNFSQFSEEFELSDMARDFIKKLTPGGLTFVSQPLDDITSDQFARKLNTDGTIGIRVSDSRIETQLARDFPIPTTPIRKKDFTETATLKEALDIIGPRYAKLRNYRRLVGVEGVVLHSGKVSTVVKEVEIDGRWYIVILREGIIPRDTIECVAKECKYMGIYTE